MRKSKFSEEQIIGILKEHDAGARAGDLCRRHGISGTTFYKWRSDRAVRAFKAAVAETLGFLVATYGYSPERRRWKNPFSASFVANGTRVYVEGINWGGSARVALGSDGEAFEDFDLLDLVRLSCPQLMPAESSLHQGQSQALQVLARLCLGCPAVELVLGGDHSIFLELRNVQRDRALRLRHW